VSQELPQTGLVEDDSMYGPAARRKKISTN
jgi:hypothetical protein